jgi:polar amino acid transport system substrate-binding protein
MRRIAPTAALLLLVAALLAGCAGDAPSGEHTVAAATAAETTSHVTGFTPRTPGVLTVGTELPNRPFVNADKIAEIDKDGYEVELANALARSFGLQKVKWVNFPFDGIVTGAACPCDLYLGDVGILPERRKVVDFSSAYYTAELGFLVRKDEPPIASIEAARALQFGAATNTSGLVFLQETLKPKRQVRVYDTDPALFLAVSAGHIDAAVTTLTDVAEAAKHDPDLRVGAAVTTGTDVGAVLAKGSANTAPVSKAIDELRAQGLLEQLRRRYLPRPAGIQTLDPAGLTP